MAEGKKKSRMTVSLSSLSKKITQITQEIGVDIARMEKAGRKKIGRVATSTVDQIRNFFAIASQQDVERLADQITRLEKRLNKTSELTKNSSQSALKTKSRSTAGTIKNQLDLRN